jgi:hypothetical protein
MPAVVAKLPFADRQPGLDAPPLYSALITPSDTDDLANSCRAFIMSVDGALKVDMEGTTDGTTPQTITWPAGTFTVKQLIPMRFRRVYATGTTAAGIVTFW